MKPFNQCPRCKLWSIQEGVQHLCPSLAKVGAKKRSKKARSPAAHHYHPGWGRAP